VICRTAPRGKHSSACNSAGPASTSPRLRKAAPWFATVPRSGTPGVTPTDPATVALPRRRALWRRRPGRSAPLLARFTLAASRRAAVSAPSTRLPLLVQGSSPAGRRSHELRASPALLLFSGRRSLTSLADSRESGARCRRPRADARACALPRMRASVAARADACFRPRAHAGSMPDAAPALPRTDAPGAESAGACFARKASVSWSRVASLLVLLNWGIELDAAAISGQRSSQTRRLV
jgi:hypothetical protein